MLLGLFSRLSFIPGVIAVLILIFGVKDVRTETKKKVSFNFKSLNPSLKRFLFIILLFGFANFSYAFFLLRAKDIGMMVALIPLLYMVYNLFSAFFSMPAGRLSD